MSIVKVEAFGGDTLQRANLLLASIPDGVKKAINAAMPRAVSHLRTKSIERIRERYAISAKNIRSEENIKVQYRIGDSIEATITISGRKIPLYRFDGSAPKAPTWDRSRLIRGITQEGWKTIPAGVPARGHVLAGTSPQLFEHAFTATMSNGHTGIFERNGSAIDEIMGLSVAQMIGNEEVAEKLAEDTSEKFEERMEHEINRLLNGWR